MKLTFSFLNLDLSLSHLQSKAAGAQRADGLGTTTSSSEAGIMTIPL